MDYWQSIILGIVEGMTEFLPISSTAHLILIGNVFNIEQTEFVKSFEIIIQLGAILAIVCLYWKKLILNKEVVQRIAVAFLPTAVFGFLLYKIVKGYLMENLFVIVWALILGGIVLVIFEYVHTEKSDATNRIENISYKNCFLIGTCQALAIIPGVSRAGATILGGLFLGIQRKTIVEFSFLVAVPTMLAATSYDLLKTGFTFTPDQFGQLGIGFAVSFVVALLAVTYFLRYIEQHDFKLFGVYRIIVGILFLLLIV